MLNQSIMRKFYVLFLFAVLSSGYGMTAQDLQLETIGDVEPVEIQLANGNRLMPKSVSTLSSLDQDERLNVLSATADDNDDYTPVEGEWVYFSWLTGQLYPTAVSIRTDSERPDYTLIKLENSFFGTLKIASHNVTGDVLNNPDRDDDGNAIYPHIFYDDGTEADVEISVALFSDGNTPELGSWNSYPLSGQGRLLARYEQSDGTLYFKYDYLINLKAKDCKIETEFTRGYYNGEKDMSVKLRKGEGVTDVYYIIANDLIDEKRTEADPDWNKKNHYYTVDSKYVKKYIEEFKLGERNEAYTVGKVDSDAEHFNVPLPTTNGVKEFYIVAFSGDEITDMVRDVIEVRLPEKWTDCGEIKLETTNNINKLGTDVILPKYYTLQRNADGSLLRIVHPFDTELNPQANYIYINQSLDPEHCYFERSLSPFESCYEIQDVDGVKSWFYYPYMTCGAVSINLCHGIRDSGLLEFNEALFIDLSNGKGIQISYLQEFDTYLLSKNRQTSYSNHSPAWTVDLLLDNFVSYEFYYKGLNFTTGKAVDHIEWTYGYNQGGQIMGADGFTSTVKIEDEKGTIDLNKLVMNGTVEHDPYRIDYRAFDKNGNVIRVGSIDTSKNNFRFVSAIGRIEYEPCYYSSLRYFVSDDVEITRRDGVRDDNETLPDGTIFYSVEGIQKTWTLRNWGSSLNHTFQIRDGQVVDGGGFQNNLGNYRVSLGSESFSGRVYLTGYVDDQPWTRLENGATVEGEFRYHVYRIDTGEFVGYFDYAYFTLYIPEDLCCEYSGVEDVAADEAETEAEYYNLQGVKVVHPAAGSLVIEKKGSKVRKLIFRD